MTVDKHFKRLVRARAARTGESYTAARWRLRRETASSSASKTTRIKSADLGFSVAIPEPWQRVTHSMWGESYPALHYQVSQGDSRIADCELNSQRLGSVRDASRAAAEAVERERSDPSVRFKYTDTILGGKPAIRLDPTNTRAPQASERRYCLKHNDHLLMLRFGTTDRTTFEPVFDSMAASIELGNPDRECLFGELSMTDYAPASIECVVVGARIAVGSGEDFSGCHLLAALVRGDSGIAASVLQTLGVAPGRLGERSRPDVGSDIEILKIPVPPAMFALLTQGDTGLRTGDRSHPSCAAGDSVVTQPRRRPRPPRGTGRSSCRRPSRARRPNRLRERCELRVLQLLPQTGARCGPDDAQPLQPDLRPAATAAPRTIYSPPRRRRASSAAHAP